MRKSGKAPRRGMWGRTGIFAWAIAAVSAAGPAPRAFAQPAVPRATIVEDLRLDANAEDFPRVRLRQASANQVWMTETDRDGLVSVVRYRVSGVSCGALSCR